MSKKIKSKKAIVIIVVALLMVAIVSVNVVSAVFFSFSLFKRDGWDKFEEYLYGDQLVSESEWINKKGEKIQINNAENESLSAIKIMNEHISHSYVIICHQYGGSPKSMEDYAKHFYDLGFNIVMPYMRGHGESSYDYISFGVKDKLDVVEWVESIIQKDKTAKIALFGVSMGANAVTLAAAEKLPENVRLVISDSCYTSVESLVKEYVKNETHFSSFITLGIISAFAENKTGKSLENADTVAALDKIEIPAMFINGEDDTVVPPVESKKLYENCDSDGVKEVIADGGTHGRNLQADEANYWANIDGFILNNLGL